MCDVCMNENDKRGTVYIDMTCSKCLFDRKVIVFVDECVIRAQM